jgi:xanthine/uracil/vitamin C permease (AzgA family)
MQYDVVGFRGTGSVPWRTAMAAVFIEGILFLILAVTGLRVKFAKVCGQPWPKAARPVAVLSLPALAAP